MTVSVVIQHRHCLMREGLRLLLDAEPEVEVVGTAATADALVELCGRALPTVVLLEVAADDWNPCETAARLQRSRRSLRFVGIAPLEDDIAERARHCGIRHVISYKHDARHVVTQLVAAAFEPAVPVRTGQTAFGERHLTEREIEVLHLIGAGCTAREISHRMEITYKTVENHKQRIFGKLGVQNQAHAVSLALRRGFLAPENLIGTAR